MNNYPLDNGFLSGQIRKVLKAMALFETGKDLRSLELKQYLMSKLTVELASLRERQKKGA